MLFRSEREGGRERERERESAATERGEEVERRGISEKEADRELEVREAHFGRSEQEGPLGSGRNAV